MKNKYAVRCLYKIDFYNDKLEQVKDINSSWEERIILVLASSLDHASNICEKYAKEYECEYINVEQQIVKFRLYSIIDIYAITDTKSRNNIEVYSNIFSATENEVQTMLNIILENDK